MKSFKSLTKFEKAWFIAFSSIILAATLWFSYTGTNYQDWKSILLNWVVSPLSALTGVACVVLVAKGNINNWWWGLINSITYGIVAWVGGYYGDWMLNWFFFVPTQIMIFYAWRKKFENKDLGLVFKSKLTWFKGAWLIIAGITATVVLAQFLQTADSWFFKSLARMSPFYEAVAVATGSPLLGPLMDSSTVIFQVFAEILLIMCLAEQWIFWAATNVVSIVIWAIIAINDPTSYAYSIPTLVMWVAFLINSTNGLINWYKTAKKE